MSLYQRNGSPEASKWKTGVDNFQGYVRAKMEDFADAQEAQWEGMRSTENRVRNLEKRGQYILGGLAIINVVIVAFFMALNSGFIHL